MYLAGLLLAAGCTSPSVTGDIRDEPVCADFELGAARIKMKGSLKKPVKISVVEDDDVRWERVLLGKRTQSDADPKFVVEDSNETYTIRWAQCPNQFAPKRVELQIRPEDMISNYACGDAVVYHEQKLEVRKGDASSRVLSWVPPPEPACWESSVPPASEEADAGAPEADADATEADAGVGGAGVGAASGGAAPSPSEPKGEAPKPSPAEPAPKAPAPKEPAPKAPAPKEPPPPAQKPPAPKPPAPDDAAPGAP